MQMNMNYYIATHEHYIIRLSEVHKKAGAELVSNGIVGRNLGTKQKVASQIPLHNAIVEEFGPVFF